MKTKTILYIYSALLLTGTTLASCTKVNYDDNFPEGDPPPVPGGYTNSSQIAKENLVAYWAFNGSLIDSISGKSATNFGATFTDGKKGEAFQGSTTAYATFDPDNSIQQLKSFTISFWINSPLNTGAIGIFTLAKTDDFWGNLDIYQDNGGTGSNAVFKVHLFNNAVPWSGQFTDTRTGFGSWRQITITYDAATSIFNIFQNGAALGVNSAGNPANTLGPKLNGSDPSVQPVKPYGELNFINATKIAFGAFQFQTNPSLTTGAGPQSWANNFTGQIDEFRIYNKALSGLEVSALYKLEQQGR
ncbi:LamG-like jellyroll fold domain-containing protein [Niabella ginsenosidivorans]|nr:LamG-like jellyroll fold domain-containing protein [Niabella ginsenosidivorans]